MKEMDEPVSSQEESLQQLRALSVPFSLLLFKVQDTQRRRVLYLELVLQLIFLGLFLAFLVFQARTMPRLEITRAIQSRFIHTPFPGTNALNDDTQIAFTDIVTEPEWGAWFANIAVSVGGLCAPAGPFVVMGDGLRVRQLRVKSYETSSNACPNLPALQGMPTSCTPPWWGGYEETTSSVEEWPSYAFMTYEKGDVYPSVVQGIVSRYPPQGFVTRLQPVFPADVVLGTAQAPDPTTNLRTSQFLSSVMQNEFVDTHSRFVSVSIILYNPNHDLAALASFYTEFTGNGDVYVTSDVLVAPLFRLKFVDTTDVSAEYVLASLVGACCILYVVLCICRVIWNIVSAIFYGSDSSRLTCQVFMRRLAGRTPAHIAHNVGWFIVDLIGVSLSLAAIAYFSDTFWSSARGTLSLSDAVGPTHEKVLVHDILQYAWVQSIFGWMLVIFTIRFFKYLYLASVFEIVTYALAAISPELLVLFLSYAGFLLLFAFAAQLIFGQSILVFHSYLTSLLTLVRSLLGEPLFLLAASNDTSYTSAVGTLFFVVFRLVFFYFLLSMFTSVFIEAVRQGTLAASTGKLSSRRRRFAEQLAYATSGTAEWNEALGCGSCCGCCRGGSRDRSESEEDRGGGAGPKLSRALEEERQRQINEDAGVIRLTRRQIAARLLFWKQRQANARKTLMTWSDLQTALRGQKREEFDVRDYEVDTLFRLVGVEDLVESDGLAAKHSREQDKDGATYELSKMNEMILKTVSAQEQHASFCRDVATKIQALETEIAETFGRVEEKIEASSANASNELQQLTLM